MFAAPAELTLGGRRFRADPRIARHYGEMEQHILSLRPNPIAVAKDSMALFEGDPDIQTELLRLAMAEASRAKAVTRGELAEWMNSIDGTVFVTWLSIRDGAPDVTREQVQAWMLEEIESVAVKLAEQAGLTEDAAADQAAGQVLDRVHDRINAISGEDDLGNLTGPPTRAGRPTEDTSRSPGEGSAGT